MRDATDRFGGATDKGDTEAALPPEVEAGEVRGHAPADTQAAIFWMKNRRPDEWRDKTEVQLTHSFADLTDEELDQELLNVLGDGIKA